MILRWSDIHDILQMPDSDQHYFAPCLHLGMFVNMDLFKKASLPSIEDYAKQLAVRKNLTAELVRSIRCLQEENLEKTVVVDTDESANSLCGVIEAIFIHGLKDKLTTKVSSVFGSTNDKMPEPEFWSYVSNYCHKNVIMEVKNLSQISNDIGRCRAWLRIALNDGLIISYLGTMLSDKSSLQKFYCTTAYLRDDEQSDIMKKLLEGIGVVHFELSCNNSILNTWTCVPLTLANIWTPPATPQPVMPAVDVIDFFTDQKSQGKSSSKNDSSNIKCKEAVEGVSGPTSKSMVDIPSKSELVSSAKSDSPQYISGDKNIDCEENNTKHTSDSDDTKLNKVCNTEKKIQTSDYHDNEDTSSKISSSDSVPDFGVEIVDDSSEMPYGSIGNKLNEKSGWSSVFDDERDQKDNEASQSYDSLLQSYNKNLSKVVIGTPELADTFSSIMGKVEDEYIDSSPDTKSPDSDFEIIPKYFTTEGADEETKRMLNIIGKICPEQGLDSQNFQCNACGRPLGLLFGKARLCHFDGFNYCYECHDNDEYIIPARIIHNWDFNKYPVAKRSKVFLSRVVKDPLLDIKILNPLIYSAVEEMAHLQLLRTQLTFLRSYIFTCKASIVEELRTRLWPREYLYEHVHLYSIDDLLEISNKTLTQTLQKIIAFAKNHVSGCQLCLLKGFICEVCNNPKPIYPFDVESTFHCEKCLAVYHAVCMDANKYCPKCVRRLKRQQMLEAASND